jgi:hypothetical protein
MIDQNSNCTILNLWSYVALQDSVNVKIRMVVLVAANFLSSAVNTI